MQNKTLDKVIVLILISGCFSKPVVTTFQTLPDSLLFTIDSIDNEIIVQGNYISYRINNDYTNSNRFLLESKIYVKYIFKNRCVYVADADSTHKRFLLFNFKMKKGDKMEINDPYSNIENANKSNCLLLHDKFSFKDDTLFAFEIRGASFVESYKDTQRLSTFYIVSEKAGILGEAMGGFSQQKETIFYWYENGHFNTQYFFNGFYYWNKVGIH